MLVGISRMHLVHQCICKSSRAITALRVRSDQLSSIKQFRALRAEPHDEQFAQVVVDKPAILMLHAEHRTPAALASIIAAFPDAAAVFQRKTSQFAVTACTVKVVADHQWSCH